MKYQPGPYGSVILPKEDDRYTFQLAQLFADAEKSIERKLDEERNRRAEAFASTWWCAIQARIPSYPQWPSSQGLVIKQVKRSSKQMLNNPEAFRAKAEKSRK